MNLPYRSTMPLLLMLAGCAVGPDFKTPASPVIDRYSNELSEQGSSPEHSSSEQPSSEQPELHESDTIPADWWTLFESKKLEQMVRQGLDNSPGLVAARARLKAAQESLNADTSSLFLPAVDVNLTSRRQKISGATFGRPGNGSLFTVHNASVDVSYSLDLFGGGRRYLEYGEARVEFEALQLQAARITLSTNIVTAAINEASLREQLFALKEIIQAESEQLQLTEKKFEIGVIAKIDLLNQQTSLAQTRTQLPTLQKALAQTRHQLAVLTGSLPGQVKLPRFTLSELILPHAIPLTLPSRLTRQRPDVRAAEAQLHQASAQVGVATANLYPNINLSASYASEAVKLTDLLSAGTAVWGLGAGLVQPLFRGGELRARKRAAEATFDQVAAQYRERVLTAFQDVADALLALDMDGRRLELEKQSEAMASETLKLVRLQHKHGAVDYLDLLNAQRQYQQSRINRIQARAMLYSDTAALMYALGGGWWNQKNLESLAVENAL